MANMKLIIVILGLTSVVIASPSFLEERSNQAFEALKYVIPSFAQAKNDGGVLEENGVALEERKAALDKSKNGKMEERQAPGHRSGIINIMEKIVNVMQTILAFADGHSTIDDIVSSVQLVFKAMEGFVNVKGIIHEIPFIGPTFLWIFSPIIDLFGSLVQNTPVFGGLLSQLIVGPSYPSSED